MTLTTYRGRIIKTERNASGDWSAWINGHHDSGYRTKSDALREARLCIDYVEHTRASIAKATE